MRSPQPQCKGLRRGEKPKMIFPSITTLILGVAVFAVLGVLDWYVWGMTPVRRYPLSPRGTRFAENDEATAFRKVA
jgi:hypothetical protein